MSMCRKLASLAAALALAPAAQAAVVWNETTSGDLSNSGSSPTFISLASGSNQIIGSSGDLGAGTDLDYFTITIPTGSQLTSMFVLPVTAPDSVAFLGIQSGNRVTTTTAAALLGWVHYGAFDVGSNVLPRIGSGAGAIGFTGPLGAGTYSFWIQDFDPGVSPYGFDLTVTAVPEPSTALALLGGLAALGWIRRRR